MGLVHSTTIPTDQSEFNEVVRAAFEKNTIPAWMRSDPSLTGHDSTHHGKDYLTTQKSRATKSSNGTIARFTVFDPTADTWALPTAVGQPIQTYLDSQEHTDILDSLDDDAFFKGVFAVATIDADGTVTEVSLDAEYWD